MKTEKIKIAATSDIHGLSVIRRGGTERILEAISKADLLTISGDIFPSYERGPFKQIEDLRGHLIPFFKKIKKPVVFTLGNHDYLDPKEIQREIHDAGLNNVFVLVDEAVCIEGVSFFGTPWTLPFLDWNYNANEEEIEQYLKRAPETEIDVFLSHGPPYGFGDRIEDISINDWSHKGSNSILEFIKERKPKWSLFGHIHSGDHQVIELEPGVSLANVSIMNERYEPVSDPLIFRIGG